MQKNKIDKKKIIIFVMILIIIIIACFFIKNVYKNQKSGHNMSNKNIEEIEEYILNISSYEAKVEVAIESNKNKNQYKLEQIYQKDKLSKQKVLEPSNIEGLEIKYENNTLSIYNAKVNLTTVYENYNYLVENFLWLNAFAQDYIEEKGKGQARAIEEDDTIIMETKTRNENNQYVYHKKLYIDKKTGKPTKLFVQDVNKKNLVYILYNEITVNGLS